MKCSEFHRLENSSDHEEDKLEASHFTDKSNDDIKLFDIKDNKSENKKLPLKSESKRSIARDSLLNDLKSQNKQIKNVIKVKEDYDKLDVTDYDEKFHKHAEDDMMDVDVVDLTDLDSEFLLVEDERERKRKQRELEFDHRKKGINLTAATTHNKLLQRHTNLLKEIAQEEVDAKKKAIERDKIIDKEFKRIEDRIKGVVEKQRTKILSYFGPLVQEKKKSAYAILGTAKRKVDLSARTKICLPFSIKIKMLRCVKDKMDAGVYVVLAEIVDRLGGAPIAYDYQKSMRNLDKLKQKIIEYEKIKLRFLKEQNIEISTQDTEALLNQEIEMEEHKQSHRVLENDEDDKSSDNENKKEKEFDIDLNKYEKLRFIQKHTKYRNFYGE